MLYPDVIPTAAGTAAAAIAQGRSDADIAFLAALFTQIGDGLALILTARACAFPASDTPPAVIDAGL